MRIHRRHAVVAAGALALAAAGVAGATAVASPSVHHCKVSGKLPDHKCTPGALNPAVTQANIQRTICVTRYTDGIRPKHSYTDQLKLEQMRWYGLTGPPGAYEEDHFISLELGGNATDPSNLWPEAYGPLPGARQKDAVERHLNRAVCNGQMTLAQAQHVIVTDWVSIWQQITP